MNKFKDFNIKTIPSNFIGDSIQIAKVFNMEIKVLAYKISNSTKKENTKLLTLQIEKQNVKRIIFTGSSVLMEQAEQIPKDKFPFITTIIIGDNDRYEFT